MFISIFDIFKIGIGPSSSHTMGPMVACSKFLTKLRQTHKNDTPIHIRVTLYGSLAFTGKGHATDTAIALGLLGFIPETLDPEKVDALHTQLKQTKEIRTSGNAPIKFDPETDIIFDYGPPLEHHANGMIFTATTENKTKVLAETYYSIGGGFVVSEEDLQNSKPFCGKESKAVKNPYPFSTANEMLKMGQTAKLSIAQMKRANEINVYGEDGLNGKIDKIWEVMSACIERGLTASGTLPGSLKVKRRAHDIYVQLKDEERKNSAPQHVCNEYLSAYAMAVNEENAVGGQIVTAPTNGAAGVIPAVIRYYLESIPGANPEGIRDFLLTAAAIGSLIKNNASISGAEVGCQGEVGSASAMAAAGLCAVMGGTNEQIENAAEIALEHHLGMTCDPVGGLVQVPCIERNGLGAVKAVTAAALALRGDGTHFIPLDSCIETMRQTGEDMLNKYKETSQGGLAVNIVEC